MGGRWLILGAVAAIGAMGCASHTAATLPDPAASTTARAITVEAISRIQPGRSTQAEVQAALGSPWRRTNYGETYCGCEHHDLQEVWEYRGVDSNGNYKLHLEFDEDGVAQTVAKIPGAGGAVRVMAAPPDDTHPVDGAHQDVAQNSRQK